VLLRTFASTHVILHAPNASFVSLLEPPAEFKALAAACKNIGAWPVLVGAPGDSKRDTMLASPIILYDYPQIAPESDGDYCDGTEMDEMLALRVLTMTDAEKKEMRLVDGVARRILERTENMPPEHFWKLHGTLRDVRAAAEFFNPLQPVARMVMVNGVQVKVGDRVRLHPKKRADALDLILAGKTAIIEAVEQDVENQIHLAVVLEEDPGRDLGLSRQPGHRFFYSTEEVEPLAKEAAR
jgi:hydrogenase maturation protease